MGKALLVYEINSDKQDKQITDKQVDWSLDVALLNAFR